MAVMYPRHIVFLFSLVLLFSSFVTGQQPVKIRTDEVLLDVVVTDRKGRPVRDLRPDELEIYEDGVKQNAVKFAQVGAAANPEKKTGGAGSEPSLERQQLNLVTILFDHLASNRIQPVRDAAFNFIDNSITGEMLVRVMVVGQKLYVIEQFTNDRAKLRKAVERATSTVEKSFAERSARVAEELTALVGNTAPAAGGLQAGESVVNPEALLARITLESLAGSEKLSREGKSNLRAFSLLPFARAHRQAPGRKLALYFSDGLYLPASMGEVIRAAVSEANRANLSFYAINIRNLLAGAGNQNSRLETATVINQSRRPETSGFNSAVGDSFSTSDRVAGRGQITTNFNMFEVLDRNKELNKEGPLADLTEGTGGFLLTVSNDLNGSLKRIGAELGNYYSVSYLPSRQEYDGKFRAITVKVLRPGLKAQSRSGYFALPSTSSSRPVLGYETPLLAALNGAVVPHDFSFAASTLHFEARANEVNHVVLLDLPLAEFIHEEDPGKKAYPVEFSVMGIIKDEKGEIVQRFSEPHQMEIPAAMIEQARVSGFSLMQKFWLSPGRYTLEAVAHDQRAGKLSAQRKPFTVQTPRAGLQTGSLFLVKEVQHINAEARDAENPLIAQDRKIIPDPQEQIAADRRGDLSFHLPIFPGANAVPPTLKLELICEGKVIAATSPKLPPADGHGRISFTAGVSTANFSPGHYRFHAVVTQAGETAEENADFTITGTVKKTDAAPEEKTIASSLSESDRGGELALLALKSVTPVELSARDLLNEVREAGGQMYARLGEYTYSLRKVRRVLTAKGKIKSEEYQDFEAYPVKGKHALVQFAENGLRLASTRIDVNRRSATELLIKSDEEMRRMNGGDQEDLNRKIGYWGASMEGIAERRGQPRRNVFVTIDPEAVFQSSELTAPRLVLLEGRETIVLDFRPRAGIELAQDKNWISRLSGTIWIDRADKSLVRIEGKQAASREDAATDPGPLNFVYQQHRLAAGVWGPSLIRINSGGDDSLFQGLNWDAWFEFSNYKRFDSHESDVKIVSPKESSPRN